MKILDVNQIIDIKIVGMNHEGQGVGRVDNFTVFIDGAIEGEKVRIKIIQVKKNYANAQILEILEKSVDRLEPICPIYQKCGGCNLQHVNYVRTIEFKKNIVIDSLKRIGKLEDVNVKDVIGMTEPYLYRNKTQYPVGGNKKDVSVGFYEKGTHNIVDCDTCKIQFEISDKVKSIVKTFLNISKIKAYDEKTNSGLIRHIIVRVGYVTKEVMVVLVVTKDKVPNLKFLIEELKNNIYELKSIVLNINNSKTNKILGEKNVVVYGEETITDYIGKYKFKISPKSFYQVNPVQTQILYDTAKKYANLNGTQTVFDLYCGIGTIGIYVSDKSKKVYGVEVVKDAVEDAKANSKLNNIENIEFLLGKAEEIIPKMYQDGIKADVVIVDPPRKGCEEKLLDTIVKMSPKRIVYVSCNPATLARDLLYLNNNGFKVQEVQPVDMFPWTHHVETVVLLSFVDSSKA